MAATEVVDRDEPLTPERQVQTLNGLYRQLISTLDEVLPLLGLVLFGDPKVARRFYRDNFAVAMDRLAQAWQVVEDRYGYEGESPDISARAVMGTALMMALEKHHNGDFDMDRAINLASEGTVRGFFPRDGPDPPAPIVGRHRLNRVRRVFPGFSRGGRRSGRGGAPWRRRCALRK